MGGRLTSSMSAPGMSLSEVLAFASEQGRVH